MSGPAFRHEQWMLQVLGWFDVRRDVSRPLADHIVEAAEQQLGMDAIRSWLPEAQRPSDDAQLRAALVRALADGHLELIDHGRAHEPMRSPHIQDLVDLVESHDEELPRPPWIEVSCVGPNGETYAFSRCRIRMPDGTHRYARLDHRSTLRLDDVPSAGTCHFELSADAKPDGGRLPPPEPKAVVYELGTAAAVVTSTAHVLHVASTPAWLELEVVDSRGRPLPHFTGTLRTRASVQQVRLDSDGSTRIDALPEGTIAVFTSLRADADRSS